MDSRGATQQQQRLSWTSTLEQQCSGVSQHAQARSADTSPALAPQQPVFRSPGAGHASLDRPGQHEHACCPNPGTAGTARAAGSGFHALCPRKVQQSPDTSLACSLQRALHSACISAMRQLCSLAAWSRTAHSGDRLQQLPLCAQMRRRRSCLQRARRCSWACTSGASRTASQR